MRINDLDDRVLFRLANGESSEVRSVVNDMEFDVNTKVSIRWAERRASLLGARAVACDTRGETQRAKSQKRSQQLAEPPRLQVEEGIGILVKTDAEALVRPAPKLYERFKDKHKLIRTNQMLRDCRKEEESKLHSLPNEAVSTLNWLSLLPSPSQKEQPLGPAAREGQHNLSSGGIRPAPDCVLGKRQGRGAHRAGEVALPLMENAAGPAYAKFET
ncbi:hypothetical protein Esti_004974 [Eimeria stiedai]